MDFTNELINDLQLGSLERDLSAVRLNDFHFTEQEKQDAMKRLEIRMAEHDQRGRWRRIAVAAALAVLVAGVGISLWQFTAGTGKEEAGTRIVPRNVDMVLTTTDGHALNLSAGGELVCSELGYLTIKGPGQTLVCTPSPQPEPTATDERMCELRVPEGKRTQIELSDGSRVWVNSATTVRFPIRFEGDERRIEVDGEAYLEVAHKAGMPFRVETSQLTVEVLGTKFGVTAYADKQTARVVLAEGRVNVNIGDTLSYQLLPGQMVSLSDGHAQTDDVEAYTYTSWKDGLLYFNGTPLGEALSWLAQQYAVDIVCSPASSRLRLYGKLVLEEHVEDVLNNLVVIEPIRYSVRNNQVFVEEK